MAAPGNAKSPIAPAAGRRGSRRQQGRKAPFLKTLGGHRRYPEHAIRKLVDGLAQEVTALPP
jgi:hypothetical protein